MEDVDPFAEEGAEDDTLSTSPVFRAAADEKFDVTVLPSLPRHFEKYSSLVTNSDPTSVFTSLCRLFDAKQVDYESDEKAFIFHAVYTEPSDSRACTFKVHFFANDQDRGETFVEFQRRTGCSLAFNALFREVSSNMGANVRKAVTSNDSFPSLLQDDELDVMKLDEKSLSYFYSSATSTSIEQVREGFSSLADASSTPDNVQTVLAGFNAQDAKNPLTQAICSSLASHDQLVSRYSSIFLANLVSHPDSRPLHNWLISDCLEPLLVLLAVSEPEAVDTDLFGDAEDSSPKFALLLNRETRRQATKIFQHLIHSHPQNGRIQDMLNKLAAPAPAAESLTLQAEAAAALA